MCLPSLVGGGRGNVCHPHFTKEVVVVRVCMRPTLRILSIRYDNEFLTKCTSLGQLHACLCRYVGGSFTLCVRVPRYLSVLVRQSILERKLIGPPVPILNL